MGPAFAGKLHASGGIHVGLSHRRGTPSENAPDFPATTPRTVVKGDEMEPYNSSERCRTRQIWIKGSQMILKSNIMAKSISQAYAANRSALKAQSPDLITTADPADCGLVEPGEATGLQGSNTTVILGVPRSGTTWLAKIFDSHPDVLYRHEPDTVLRTFRLPKWVSPGEVHLHRKAARAYLRQLSGIRTVKSAGSLPVFRKNFHSSPTHLMRSLMIYGLRAAQLLPRAHRLVRQVPIPDMVQTRALIIPHLVAKSVDACGRACLVADTIPSGRIILILRNPCGHVASMIRGLALRKFESPLVFDDLLATEQGVRHVLTAERLHGLTAVERLAWRWVLLNEKALEDLSGTGIAEIITYEALAADPIDAARKLFAFAGLDWHPNTEAFIRRSTSHRFPGHYFQVFQNTPAVVNRWRTELSYEDTCRIARIVRTTSLWRFFPELQEFVPDQERAAN